MFDLRWTTSTCDPCRHARSKQTRTSACHLLVKAMLVVSMLAGAGCSGPRLKPGKAITIRITFAGKPITGGQIDLSGEGGGARLNEAGIAAFKHVPYGQYRVTVFPAIDMNAIPSEDESKPAPAVVSNAALIPRKFRDEGATPLTIDVQPSESSTFQFDLKS